MDISIIVPVYNASAYIRECLNSLVKQENIICEIICVDDASTDNSKQILLDYQKKFNFIRILELTENHGQAYARNVGLSKAVGEFVYFVDADDYLLSNEALYQILQKISAEKTDCLIFDAVNIYESEKIKKLYNNWEHITESVPEGSYKGEYFFSMVIENNNPLVTVWRELWRRKFLEEHNIGFREDTSPHEDLIFWLESMISSNVYYWKKKIYGYRVRETSSSMTLYDKKRFLAHFHCYYYGKIALYENKINKGQFSAVKSFFTHIARILHEQSIPIIKSGEDLNVVFDDIGKTLEYYSCLMRQYPYLGRLFSPKEYEQLINAKLILIYGAGKAGMDVKNMLHDFGITDTITVVTKRSSDMSQQVREIDEFVHEKNETVVVIGVTKIYQDEIQKELKKYGFKRIISLND